MRVGVLTPRYPPTMRGGGEVSVQLLAEHLSTHSSISRVTVFAFDGNEQLERDGATNLDVRRVENVVDRVPEVGNLQAAVAMREYEDLLNACDVLHAYNMALNPVAGYLSEKYDIPGVATLNSYDILPKAAFGVQPKPSRHAYELFAMPTTGRVLRHYIQKLDRFITLSDASKAVYQRNGFDQSIDVVPNMRDPSFEPPERRPRTDGFELLYVGSLIKEKGVESLVRAVPLLADDVSVTIVGDGPQRNRLYQLSSSLGVADRVTFAGHVPYEQVPSHYATASAFVHPGIWPEPFGRTILEAMESSLPVLVSDIGGPAEIITDPRWRFAPGTPSALADAVERFRRFGTGVGEQNYERVQERYAPEKVVSQVVRVYQNLIS